MGRVIAPIPKLSLRDAWRTQVLLDLFRRSVFGWVCALSSRTRPRNPMIPSTLILEGLLKIFFFSDYRKKLQRRVCAFIVQTMHSCLCSYGGLSKSLCFSSPSFSLYMQSLWASLLYSKVQINRRAATVIVDYSPLGFLAFLMTSFETFTLLCSCLTVAF